MVTKTIDLQTNPTDLESLLAQLTPDTEIVLKKGNITVGRLTGSDEPIIRKKRVAGLGGGTTFIVSDDFDDPLPDEFWLGQE